jgi:hypothetical protein
MSITGLSTETKGEVMEIYRRISELAETAPRSGVEDAAMESHPDPIPAARGIVNGLLFAIALFWVPIAVLLVVWLGE